MKMFVKLTIIYELDDCECHDIKYFHMKSLQIYQYSFIFIIMEIIVYECPK